MPVRLLRPRRFGDARGWFSETYNAATHDVIGPVAFVQDNHSYSQAPFVLRGLHLQRPPFAQAKLVRCSRGSIWDVAVDVRRGSPTYGRWVAAELSAANGLQIFIPAGFAHGLLTLEADTEVQYKVDAPYSAESEDGVIWNDSTIGLPWPLMGSEPQLSGKDAVLGPLADFDSPFEYDGRPLEPLKVP
jgi:dTDP-4-dehydrorhamnose 3,5-epimerase